MGQDKLKNLLEMGSVLAGINEQADKNLFEMANLREYRHSAILGYLLGREEHGNLAHLESFLKRLFPDGRRLSTGKVYVACEKWVDCGATKRPIDVLVTTPDFALIIENKCCGASDQLGQIRDYWNGVCKEPNRKEQDIFVLYLPPLNTFTLPSKSSLGDLGERFGKGGDLEGHLLVYSFRDLVLPWLKEDVLPKISYGTGKLVDSIKCYIDFLEGQFYVHSDNGDDPREKMCESFGKLVGVSNADEMWTRATELLGETNYFLEETTSPKMTERDADSLVNLRCKFWDVRSILREKNPLLDPSNLSYEVYWLLRRNPTPFASQYIRFKLETGLFFLSGRKQSAWDSIEYKGHWLECWFHVDEFVKFCRGEDCGTILTFGIGNVAEEDFPKLQNAYNNQTEYLSDKRWRTVFVGNEKFHQAKGATGGEMLWLVAEAVAAEAKAFSDAVAAEVG